MSGDSHKYGNVRGDCKDASSRDWTVRGIQWPEFQHGVETWVLWMKRGRTRVVKIDGKWTLEQLGLEVGHGR